MKKIILTLVVACSMLSAFAQTAEEIVAKHITAIGGAENWKKVKSVVMEANIKAQGAEIKVTRTMVDKKAMRMDISVMGMDGYSIITNKEGWNFMPFAGQTKPEPMTADELKTSQDQLLVADEFLSYQDKGKKLEYIGKDDLEGTDCFKMKLTDKDGQETTFWLDATNYYILKSSAKIKADGKEVENSSTFSNYKKLDEGIVYPMSMGGDNGEIEITKVTINSTIDESIFVPKTK